MASASLRSHLVLQPWTAFMAQAWPRTKAMWWSRQVSASQYQGWTHSQATRSPSRKGATARRKGWGAAGGGGPKGGGAAGAGGTREREAGGGAARAGERGWAGGGGEATGRAAR